SDALEYFHSHHIVPLRRQAPNFLFDLNSASGLIKLIDFGLAKVYFDSSTHEHCSQRKRNIGAALCSGYDPVFGEFIDYTRSLVFQETPDYAGWRRRFLTIAPELCGRPLYNPADRGVKLREGRRAPRERCTRRCRRSPKAEFAFVS
ncbi:hypothetical protein BD626DRAFT_521196, partial [Schizophyllum amplum]